LCSEGIEYVVACSGVRKTNHYMHSVFCPSTIALLNDETTGHFAATPSHHPTPTQYPCPPRLSPLPRRRPLPLHALLLRCRRPARSSLSSPPRCRNASSQTLSLRRPLSSRYLPPNRRLRAITRRPRALNQTLATANVVGRRLLSASSEARPTRGEGGGKASPSITPPARELAGPRFGTTAGMASAVERAGGMPSGAAPDAEWLPAAAASAERVRVLPVVATRQRC
jgi:hypothetical protein